LIRIDRYISLLFDNYRNLLIIIVISEIKNVQRYILNFIIYCMPYLKETYYRAGLTILTSEAIKEIKESRGKVSNAAKKIVKKYHISPKRC
jgi:hypothetical protein